MSSRKIKIKIKDKEFEIEFIRDLKILQDKIISLLEKEYNKKLKDVKNLYKIYYLDEENDRNYIKTPEDYNFFINISEEIFTEVDEELIEKLRRQEADMGGGDIDSNSPKELELMKEIEKLKKENENLKKEKVLFNEISQIHLEKIKMLEEDAKLKNEKEQSILKMLEDVKKENNEILCKLDESQKLNESFSMMMNNKNNKSITNDDNINDIMVNNLKEEKEILKNQLMEERNKINLIEKIYNEDNDNLKQTINKMKNELDTEKQNIIKNNDLLIKNEIEKGINEYISKSKINLEQKDNEINKIKNDYENKINSIREECYQEIEEKYSKIYEEKVKQIFESTMSNSKIIYDNIISENKKNFEEEEKKRNQLINANIIMNSNINNNSNNFSKISQCRTIHSGISCNNCKTIPIVGYRYKCLECSNYNLCQQCEKTIEHEHNLIKFVNEDDNSLIIKDIKYSYKCLSSKLRTFIHIGTEKAKFNIVIKNDGNLQWTKNTKFIFGKNSQMLTDYIKLKPLEPNEQDNIEIEFDGLKYFVAGTYASYLLLSVDGKVFGEPLKLESVIVENK
jgi:hypothetical protein